MENCRLHVGTPVEVGKARGHFWFSTLHPVEGLGILCEVITTADEPQGKWPALLYLSQDSGDSWRLLCNIDSYGPVSVPYGPCKRLFLPYELWPRRQGDKRNAVADGTLLVCHKGSATPTGTIPVEYVGLPQNLADYHENELCLLTNGNVLSLRDGRLFSTLYGKFVEDEKYSNLTVVSGNGGATWRFLSVVADGKSVPWGREGPNESNSVHLGDGRLMCVYRVGGGQEYHKSYSADDGLTWSRPERMKGVWSVEPQLRRLDNGLILLSGGRPGLFLWVCDDGEGRRWERFNLADHHNASTAASNLRYNDRFCEGQEMFDPYQSTSYTGMQELGPDEVLVSYDRLGNGWQGSPGPWGKTDAVFTVRVKAVPL